jgi:hypothetical protein
MSPGTQLDHIVAWNAEHLRTGVWMQLVKALNFGAKLVLKHCERGWDFARWDRRGYTGRTTDFDLVSDEFGLIRVGVADPTSEVRNRYCYAVKDVSVPLPSHANARHHPLWRAISELIEKLNKIALNPKRVGRSAVTRPFDRHTSLTIVPATHDDELLQRIRNVDFSRGELVGIVSA